MHVLLATYLFICVVSLALQLIIHGSRFHHTDLFLHLLPCLVFPCKDANMHDHSFDILKDELQTTKVENNNNIALSSLMVILPNGYI